MVYAALADVQAQLPLTTLSVTSKPNTTQVATLIAACASEIDSAIATRGLAVPITAPAWLVTDLTRLNAEGAAAMCLMAMFPEEQGPASNALGPMLFRDYKGRIGELRKGIGLPANMAVAEADLAPRSYITDVGGYGAADGDVTDAWGDSVQTESVFTLTKVL